MLSSRDGAWNATMGAVLRLCAQNDPPPSKELEVWESVFALLVDAGRVDEARTGLRLATAGGAIGAPVWLRFALRLYGRGDVVGAWLAVEESLTRLPPDAVLMTVAAFLRYEHGMVEEAEEAIRLAQALDGCVAVAHLAAALLLARRGDAGAAREACAAARRGGVPQVLVDRYARRCGLG